jgi:hypothetical protein
MRCAATVLALAIASGCDSHRAADLGARAPGPPPPPQDRWLMLSDFDGNEFVPAFWTTFVDGKLTNSGPAAPTDEVAPPRGTGKLAMRVRGPATPGGIDVNTHHHIDWTQAFSAVRFWARASGDTPTEIIFAITELGVETQGYFGGQRAGRPWRAKRVPLTAEWRLYTLELGELAPETAGEPVPLLGGPGMGSALHFVVPEGRAHDLWVDDIELRCRPGACQAQP